MRIKNIVNMLIVECYKLLINIEEMNNQIRSRNIIENDIAKYVLQQNTFKEKLKICLIILFI